MFGSVRTPFIFPIFLVIYTLLLNTQQVHGETPISYQQITKRFQVRRQLLNIADSNPNVHTNHDVQDFVHDRPLIHENEFNQILKDNDKHNTDTVDEIQTLENSFNHNFLAKKKDQDEDEEDEHETIKEMPITKEDLKYIEENMDKGDSLTKKDDEKNTNTNTIPGDAKRELPPPDTMVAGEIGQKMKHLKIGARRELTNDNGFSPPVKESDKDLWEAKYRKLENENNDNTVFISKLLRSEQDLKSQVFHLTKDMEKMKNEAKFKLDQYAKRLENSKNSFKVQLESATEEQTNEIEELKTIVDQQKKAFDELLEEKQVLSRVLSDEQGTLTELQEKIQHPDLGLWLRQRAKKAAILIETPETDAMRFYAAKYMAPKVHKLQHKLQILEKRVEKTVDHLLPAKYGGFVAFILSIVLIGFPTIVTISALFTLSKAVSIRQYVLLGNIFLAAFSGGLCVVGILLKQDPLQTLYEASEGIFITLQIATASLFPLLLGTILCTVWKSRNLLDLCAFGCEFVFYILVAVNYHSRVWKPAMLGQNIETNAMMYIVYFMDFLAMTVLTISSSQTEEDEIETNVEDREKNIKTKSSKGNLLPVSSTFRPGKVGSVGQELLRAIGRQTNGVGKNE